MNNISISEYLFQIQSKGRFSLTLEELREHIKSSDKALLQNLHRLKAKNQIVQIRKKFYTVLPPQYAHQGSLPSILFMDDMMKYLKRDYYFGLYTAAAFHGAGHQQPMESQILIHKPAIRAIKNKKQTIIFFTKKDWKTDWIDQKKTEAGYINVSSPELTAIDLVNYHKKIGGLNRIISILEDLVENIGTTKLVSIANESNLPTIQRLGYLFEQLGKQKLSEDLEKYLGKIKTNTVPLSLSHKNKEDTINKKWNLQLNTTIEF